MIDNVSVYSASHTHPIDALMRPQSVAIIGMSSREGTPSRTVLGNLERNGFAGDIYLVGKGGFEVGGRPCLSSIAELPKGVDLAIMVVGADAVADAIAKCVAAGVRSAVCFASGFAEIGDAGRLAQEEIGRLAKEGGLALIGPNCVGYANYIDRFSVMLVELGAIPQVRAADGPTVAIVAQSGGIGAHLGASLLARGVPVSYMMTTGNEASLGLSDLVEYYVSDSQTQTILVYAEQVRRPDDLLKAAAAAAKAGKSIAILHPGKSATAQAAAASHTGALAGDYAAMRVALEANGLVVADTLEELIDLGELLVRCRLSDSPGLGIVTASGALCAIAQDYCEELGLAVPPMSDEQVAQLAGALPDYTPPRNPLDLGTLAAWKPELLGLGIQAMLDDPAIGSVLVSFPYGEASLGVPWIEQIVSVARNAQKPVIYAIHDEGVPLPAEVERIAKENRIVITRSPERTLRALRQLDAYREHRRWSALRTEKPRLAVQHQLSGGTQPEWQGKALLRQIGLVVPDGDLAVTADDAARIAADIGYPVVIKAQASALAHKSDIGGVILNIGDEGTLRRAWLQMADAVAKANPDLVLDGILVEKMSGRGTELVIGAKRDPNWGPMLLVGLGGVWIEALGDVRLLPANASVAEIKDALLRLRASRLLTGFRGAAPVDLDAVAEATSRIGTLMISYPRITEIDINPFVVFEQGQGGVALDALVVIA